MLLFVTTFFCVQQTVSNNIELFFHLVGIHQVALFQAFVRILALEDNLQKNRRQNGAEYNLSLIHIWAKA